MRIIAVTNTRNASALNAGPLLSLWRSGNLCRAERYPDAVTDTNIRRYVKASALKRQADGVSLQAQRLGGLGELCHAVKVKGVSGGLYEPVAHREALEEARAVLGEWPALAKLEGVAFVSLHTHLLAPVEAVPALERAGYWCNPVKAGKGHLMRLLRYLGKPSDSRACRHNHEREAAAVAVAAEDYLRARAELPKQGRKALPKARAVLNVPRDVQKAANGAAFNAEVARRKAARAAIEIAALAERLAVYRVAVALIEQRAAARLEARRAAVAVALVARQKARAAVRPTVARKVPARLSTHTPRPRSLSGQMVRQNQATRAPPRK